MQDNESVVTLESLSTTNMPLAGGKARALAHLIQNDFQVPSGSAILASAFNSFIDECGLTPRLRALSGFDRNNINELKQYCQYLTDILLSKPISTVLQAEIYRHFDSLNTDYVAVRSSAACEDSQKHSWAGRLDTFLNTDSSALLENIRKCWASMFSLRSIHYALAQSREDVDFAVAIIVQKMLKPEVSGVCFTINPVSQACDQIIIEAGYGLGESIVGGLITPDMYIVGKRELEIREAKIGRQITMISQAKEGNRQVSVPDEISRRQKLRDMQIMELAKLCKDVEKLFGMPQDIEWALEGEKLFILQSRPIVTL